VKPILVAAVIFGLLALDACSKADGQDAGRPSPETRPAAQTPETVPASKPASAPVAKAPESKKLITLKAGMQKVADSDLEGSLEKWADGDEINLQHVIKRTGVYVKVAAEVQWTDAKKRELDPKDFDRLVTESQSYAKQLVGAATANASQDEIKKLAGDTLDRCTGCHLKYK
jgi:cytochrome c'